MAPERESGRNVEQRGRGRPRAGYRALPKIIRLAFFDRVSGWGPARCRGPEKRSEGTPLGLEVFCAFDGRVPSFASAPLQTAAERNYTVAHMFPLLPAPNCQ